MEAISIIAFYNWSKLIKSVLNQIIYILLIESCNDYLHILEYFFSGLRYRYF